MEPAERLLIERARQGLSRQELAERSGVNAHTISDLERKIRKPRETTLVKLAEALAVRPEELWESDAPKASAPLPETDSATAHYVVPAEDLAEMFRNLARRGRRIVGIVERSVREGASEELSREVTEYSEEAATLRRVKGGRDIRGKDPEELVEAFEDFEEVEARIQSMLVQDLSASPAERAERQRFKDDKGSGYPEERGANAS